MIFGQLPHGGQFVFQAEVHSLSQPMALRFRGSGPIVPQSSFRYPQVGAARESGVALRLPPQSKKSLPLALRELQPSI
jgi:hypothetical protein